MPGLRTRLSPTHRQTRAGVRRRDRSALQRSRPSRSWCSPASHGTFTDESRPRGPLRIQGRAAPPSKPGRRLPREPAAPEIRSRQTSARYFSLRLCPRRGTQPKSGPGQEEELRVPHREGWPGLDPDPGQRRSPAQSQQQSATDHDQPRSVPTCHLPPGVPEEVPMERCALSTREWIASSGDRPATPLGRTAGTRVVSRDANLVPRRP